jgi:hypothetical protein
MKFINTKVLTTTAMLMVLAGCGNDKKTSGAGAPAPAPEALTGKGSDTLTNTVTGPATGNQAVIDSLRTWYNASESATIGFRGTYIRRTQAANSAGFQVGFSLCLGPWGINCGPQSAPTPTHCYVRNGDGVNYDTGVPNSGAPFGCSITRTQATKATNAELTQAVNGPAGLTLLQATTHNGVYSLVYGNHNVYGHGQIQAVYTIDTRLHSILNPVMIQSTTSSNVLVGVAPVMSP